MNNNKNGFLARLLGGLLGKGRLNASESNATTARPDPQPQTPPRGLPQAPQPASPAPVSSAASGATPQPAERERVVRVFISSTFKDMIEDRNTLMAQTWPALRKLCRERSVEFVEVDLRWGITEEQSKRKETVQYCLDEIRRCRPYFIGLLGERYGWVPEGEAFPEPLLEREGWLKPEIARRSATELEILHGVLNDPTMAGRAFFYFRDPAFSERLAAAGEPQMVEGSDPQEVEKHGAAEAARRAQWRRERLADLKGRIRTLCQERGMPLRDADRYADPERLAALVLADLTAAIEAEFPADRVPDAFAREARDHEAYAQSRRSPYYIGRDAYFERLDAYARDGADGCGLAVLGESGGGKSALLANWLGRWRQAHPDAFVFQHYIGSSPMSAGHLALMRRLMVAIVRWCAEPGTPAGFGSEEERIPAQSEEIVKVFPEYLGRLAYQAKQRGVPALIVLDALNQIEDRERGRLLAWLPYRMPLDLRLVVSTLPGETLEALGPRGWPGLTVEPLGAAERAELIARYLRHHSRGLSEARTRAIAEATSCANPLYLKTLLDDLRATGVNRLLDAQIADYLQAQDIPALLVKVLARYERDYEGDRPGLVREALSLIWAARRGLTEPELLAVLKPEDKPQLPAAYWTPIGNALAESLVDRGGVLAFAHEHLRRAVERRYLPDQDSQDQPRLRLADWFEVQPITARSCDELPWLLRQLEDRAQLRACLLDIERFLLIQARDQNDLLADWVWLGDERAMGHLYVDSFAQWERGVGIGARNLRVSYVANELGYFLDAAGLPTSAEPLFRQALQDRERTLGMMHPETLLSTNNLAHLLGGKGELARAESLYRRAVEGQKRILGPAHPDTLTSMSNMATLLGDKGDLARAELLLRNALEGRIKALGPTHPHTLISMHNLASLLQKRGDLGQAETLCRRALEASERALGPTHPLTLVSLGNLASLLRAQGDLAKAESLVRRALEGQERALGLAHPSTLSSINNLASLLQAKGDLAGAELLYRRTLQVREQVVGPTHHDTLVSLNNLADLLRTKGDFTGAEPFYRRAADGFETAFGAEHPDTLTTLSNLAVLLKDKGDLASAEPLMRRALEGRERALGPEHRDTLTTFSNLADLLFSKGDWTGAEPLHRRVLEGFARALGPGHPDALTSLNNLAGLLQAKGDLAGAERLFRQALKGFEQALGPRHPDTLRGFNNLAFLLQERGDLVGAEPLYRQALEGCERVLGPTHPITLTTLNNLGLLLYTRGDLSEAEPLSRRALEGRRRTLGQTHPVTLASLHNLAALLHAKRDRAAAEPLYRQALDGYERVLGAGHPETLGILNNLAALLLANGDIEGAGPLLRRSISGLIDISRRTQQLHPNLQSVVGNYVGLLQRLGVGEQGIAGELAKLAPDLFSAPDAAKADDPPRAITAEQARGMALDLYRRGEYANAQILLEQLLSHGFEIPGTQAHLARIALVTGDAPGAAIHAAQAWEHRAEAPPYVVPRILWLQLAARLLAPADAPDLGPDPAVLLGRLKTALAVEGVQMEWTMDPVLDHLKPLLAPDDHALLTAMVAALSFPDKGADLDAIPAWSAAAPQPLE